MRTGAPENTHVYMYILIIKCNRTLHSHLHQPPDPTPSPTATTHALNASEVYVWQMLLVPHRLYPWSLPTSRSVCLLTARVCIFGLERFPNALPKAERAGWKCQGINYPGSSPQPRNLRSCCLILPAPALFLGRDNSGAFPRTPLITSLRTHLFKPAFPSLPPFPSPLHLPPKPLLCFLHLLNK